MLMVYNKYFVIPLFICRSLWDVSEPNNFGNGEDCVVLKDNALWNDLDCTALRPYICVRPYGK